MDRLILDMIIFLYAAAGILTTLAYWPTIRDLYQKKPSANITSYVLWTGASGVSVLYSLFVLPDFLFQVVSFMNLAACTAILALRIALKKGEKAAVTGLSGDDD
jgi:uncharacterized protein with PQ loop repeat